MSKINSGVALNLDKDILAACLPLLEASKIDSIEWSFDALHNIRHKPTWFIALLKSFADANRLIGHGIYYSLFLGKWTKDQKAWLDQLRETCEQFHFEHITEHFGFMLGEEFHKGAPLSIPFNQHTLQIGRDRLMRLQDACRCPVGLENLAFAFYKNDVLHHGEFLTYLIEAVNGFIILDLHNLYCQMHNFNCPIDELLKAYPLDRIREIHISGGSWSSSVDSTASKIRRDTHDNSVPNEVLDLLKEILPKCPNVRFVILEQLGNGLNTDLSRKIFQSDFTTIQQIVHSMQNLTDQNRDFMPITKFLLTETPPENVELYAQQMELSHILNKSKNIAHAKQLLAYSSLADSDWRTEIWSNDMLHTAIELSRKWNPE